MKGAGIAFNGVAGENLVKLACIANGKHGYFGRCGLGAVMGSKNLKALVVRGTLKPPIANPDKFKSVYQDVLKRVKESEYTTELREHGQAGDCLNDLRHGEYGWNRGSAAVYGNAGGHADENGDQHGDCRQSEMLQRLPPQFGASQHCDCPKPWILLGLRRLDLAA